MSHSIEVEDDFGDVLTEARPSLPPSEGIGFRLEQIEGKSAVFDIEPDRPGRALIGTSPACDIRISDREVSRRHAAVEVVAEGLKVTDLGSTNGTWVGPLRIREAYLQGGETLRVGQTVLHVARAPARKSTPRPSSSQFGTLIGASPAMRRLQPLFERLATSAVPVLIEGETGTGKEELAKALHERSARREGPFVVLDCTAVAPSVVESELFGHEHG